MAFLRNNDNYGWLNQPGGGVLDPIKGAGGNNVVVSPPQNYPSCASTMGQCPCSYGGCMDSSFMEYNANATCDDGSCATAIVQGCTDQTATNFDANANVDDGSCVYPVMGCTDPTAANYSAQATQDDGSCAYPGCADPNAVNYNPNANYDCSGNAVAAQNNNANNNVNVNQNYAKFGGSGYSSASGCGSYSQASGCGYSNFNQRGFGGYEDKLWF